MGFFKSLIVVFAVAASSLALGESHAYGDLTDVVTTSTGAFGTLDLQTGAFTQGGTAGPYGDITYLAGQHLYGDTGVDNLVILNPATGAVVSTVGSMGHTINGVKFNASGTLYGYSPTALYTVNTTSGAATLIGSYGISTGANYGGTFAGNTFYLQAVNASNNTLSNLYSVNTSTGLATLIGATGYKIDGLDYEGSTLYGFTASDQIISLNASTGVGTFLATDGAGAVFSATLAPSVVPEPPTWVGICLGLVVVATAMRIGGRKLETMGG